MGGLVSFGPMAWRESVLDVLFSVLLGGVLVACAAETGTEPTGQRTDTKGGDGWQSAKDVGPPKDAPPLVFADTGPAALDPGSPQPDIPKLDAVVDTNAVLDTTLASDGSCTPQCDGKTCGPNGCGGSCGACASGQTCAADGHCLAGTPGCVGIPSVGNCIGNLLQTCQGNPKMTVTTDCKKLGLVCGWSDTESQVGCVPGPCEPNCSGKTCGTNGCDGFCGFCFTGQACLNGLCQIGTCTGDCTGKQCGDDGCGGSCGTCGDGQGCDSLGKCGFALCVPKCLLFGYECGDDGCGKSCGTCASGLKCEDGKCS